LQIQALFLVLFGIFSNKAWGNCIAGSLHQHPIFDLQEEMLLQLLFLLHKGQAARSILFIAG
jgi:hypothetical protein